MAALILVVDDDEPVRVMLARLLNTRGHRTALAANAAEARLVMRGSQPDLVISDIVMPGESGIDLRRWIAGEYPGLPVLLISGYSPEGPADFAATTPLTRFVQKPFAADDFLDLVTNMLSEPGSPAGQALS